MEGCDSDDESTSGYLLSNQAKGYSYEEQFKQLYDLSPDPDRKTFLNDLFSYMQNRGTPVNRIPIMAKQVLDLYELYRLVVARGGLVEVINKKIWREITRGLNLPSSITSAAFTLRTQYMKYLYPYECEKEHLSSPEELQQAIDGNRREGRRSSYGHYSDMVGSPVGAGGSGGSGGGSCEGLAGPSAAGGPSGFNGSSSGAVGGGNNGGGPSTSSSSHRNVSTPLHHLASSSALSLVNRHLLNGVGPSVNGHGNRLSGGAVGGNQSLNDCGSGSSGDEEDHGSSSLHSLSLNPLLALASAQAQVQAQAEALNLEVKPSLGHNGLSSSSSHRNISSPLSLVNRHIINGGGQSVSNNNNGHNNRSGLGRNANQGDLSVPMDDCGSGSSGEDEDNGSSSLHSLSLNPLLAFASAQAQAEAVNLDVKGGNGLSALAGLNGPLSSLQAHFNNLSSANNQNMETNNNNQLLLSMKINNIIYSGILYATRSVKR